VDNWFKRFAAAPPAIPTPGAPAAAPPPGGGTGAQRVVINGNFVDAQIRDVLINPVMTANIPREVANLLASVQGDPVARTLMEAVRQGKFAEILNPVVAEFFAKATTDKVVQLLIELSLKGAGKLEQLMNAVREYDGEVSLMVRSGTEDGVRRLEAWYGNLLSALPEVVSTLGVPGSFRQIPGATSSGESAGG